MDIPVKIPPLANENLTIRTAVFKRPQLLKNGKPIKGKKRTYAYKDNSGKDHIIKLDPSIFDPIPKIIINDDKHELIESFKWYEYGWLGLPLLLIFQGGAIGGAVGGFFTYLNAIIFRSDINIFGRYLFTGLSSIVSVAIYLGLAILFLGSVEKLTRASPQELLSVAVSGINEFAPQQLDEITILQEAYAEGERSLVYSYKLQANQNEIDFNQLIQQVYSNNVDYWCNDPKTEDYRKFLIKIIYRYQDNTGQTLGDVVIDTSNCN